MAQEAQISQCAYWLALASIDGIGAKRVRQLIARFGLVENIFHAPLSDIAFLPRFNPLLATQILQAGKNLGKF